MVKYMKDKHRVGKPRADFPKGDLGQVRYPQPINTCPRIRIGRLAFLYLFLLSLPGCTVVKKIRLPMVQ